MIQFANPSALWLLLLLIPLIVLYLLKQKRQEVVVPSTFLWRRALEDVRARTPFQKLRTNLLLFLQILALVLITAALAQPFLQAQPRASARMILAIDVSASMKATDESPDRFHVARKTLSEYIDRANPEDEIMLVAFSTIAQVVHTFTRDHEAIRRALNEMKPEDRPGEFAALRDILEPVLKSTPRPSIVIASDFANFPDNWPAAIPFQPIRTGRNGNNIGITRAALQTAPENPLDQTLFFQVRNFSNRAEQAEIQIRRDGAVVDVLETRLSAGSNFDYTTSFQIPQPARIDIHVKPSDQFSVDNDFRIHALPSKKARVLSEISDPPLLHALRILPSVEASNSASIRIAQAQSPGQLRGPGIFFWPDIKNETVAEVVAWNESHPALRFVDARLWRISGYRILQVPPGAQTLMETSEGPVAYAYDADTRRIVFGFAFSKSNVYELAGFPVFLQNALQWIDAALRPALPVYTSAQHPHEGKVQSEAGESYVNLADALESNIQPEQVLSEKIIDNSLVPSRKDLSLWFLIALLAVVIFEWWVFHRRVHVSTQ